MLILMIVMKMKNLIMMTMSNEDFDFDTTVIDEKGWDCDQSTYAIECGIEIKEH